MLESPACKQLHTHADSQKRLAVAFDGLRQGFQKAWNSAKASHAIGEGTDARKNNPLGCPKPLGVGRHLHMR